MGFLRHLASLDRGDMLTPWAVNQRDQFPLLLLWAGVNLTSKRHCKLQPLLRQPHVFVRDQSGRKARKL